jgi:hypothetical protein
MFMDSSTATLCTSLKQRNIMTTRSGLVFTSASVKTRDASLTSIDHIEEIGTTGFSLFVHLKNSWLGEDF